MAGQSKKVQIQLGLLTIPVRLEKATDAETSDTKTVCAGTQETPHPPALVKQSMGCTMCNIKHSSHYPFPRGAEQADGTFVVVDAEELKKAAGEPVKSMTMQLHTRAEVFGATVASDSVQNMAPDKGGEKAYAALRNALTANPDLVAATVWAPSTKNALWVLEVVQSRLVVSKRCWPEDVRVPPVIAEVEVSRAEQDMFNQFVTAAVTSFTLETYSDAARAGRAALIAERAGESQPLAAEPVTPAAAGGDLLSALQASLKAVEPVKKPARKKAPAKKRAPKKPVEPAA